MTPELLALVAATLVQVVQYALYAVAVTRDLGADYTMSPRDRPPARPLSPRTGRLKRALDNHFEGLLLFAIACIITTLAGASGTLATACAITYVAARVLYVPAYAFGWTPWRSLIWGLGFLATLVMIGAVFF